MDNLEKLGLQVRRKTKQKHNIMCWTPLYAHNHKWRHEPSYRQIEYRCNAEIVTDMTTRNPECKDT